MRTKLSTCARKRRYQTAAEALSAAQQHGLPQLPYQCDRCWQYHLTSRLKGKRPHTPMSA